MFLKLLDECGKARFGLLLKKPPAGNALIAVFSGHAPDFVDAGP
jgi:hypothetical protein